MHSSSSLEVETLTGFEPAFIHNDLSAPHLLVHNGSSPA